MSSRLWPEARMRTGLDRGHFEEARLFRAQEQAEHDPNPVRLGERIHSRGDTESRRRSAMSSEIHYPRSSVICFNQPTSVAC